VTPKTLLGHLRKFRGGRVAALEAERAPDDDGERPGDHEQPDDEEAERVDVQPLDLA
jgi:hypothetical protein